MGGGITLNEFLQDFKMDLKISTKMKKLSGKTSEILEGFCFSILMRDPNGLVLERMLMMMMMTNYIGSSQGLL